MTDHSPPTDGSGPSWLMALKLEEGESVVKFWQGDHEFMGSRLRSPIPGGRLPRAGGFGRSRERGVLVLTNLRLAFVEGEGASGGDYRVSMEVPLSQVFDASMGGVLMRHVRVGTSMGNLIFHLREVDRASFDEFRSSLEAGVGRPLTTGGGK